MNRRAHWIACLVAMAACLVAQGCGYAHRGLYPEGIRSVAVPIFENRTFYRGAEFDLTEALIKEIELRTPYKVVAEAGADSVLQGTIVSITQRTLSHRRVGAVPLEMEVRMVVNFEWKDLRTGKVIRDRRGFDRVGRYIPAREASETYEIAQHQAAQALAQEIVSVMRADW